jgi:hypothetical protein
MPVVATNAPKNAVTPIFLEGTLSPPHYTVAPDDTYASVQRTPPAGALVILPGPDSTGLTELPSNGDYYKVSDPLGRISGGAPVGVWGGGYPIQGSSHTTPTADVSLTTAFSDAEFTFDDAAQAWIACVCVPLGD